ncbi:MAG: transcriptional repressor [Deltaproteobacteria bacterium]|nr:transcriptional repressor [Deltaproteobacteria bacterium]MCL4872685.1 transcriptional repressor [bacterium]
MQPENKIDILKSYIEAKGLKSTSQRDFIADTFFRTNTHISLDELLKKVKRKTPNIGYATVYRTMKLLTECGLAISRQFGDGQTRYENLPEDGHHDHIICIKCSRIAEFHNQKIEQLQAETAKKLGFTVVNHKLELYGYCPDCA